MSRMHLWLGPLVGIAVSIALGYVITAYEGPVPVSKRRGVDVVTDEETGCQYITYRYTITPRLATNGHQICNKPGEVAR